MRPPPTPAVGVPQFGRRALLLLVSMAAGGGLTVWTLAFLDLRHTELFMQDWFVYYAAGIAARSGRLALMFDPRAFTDFQYGLLRSWYVAKPALHPWFYPPPFLLILAPLSLLSFPVSYVVFQLTTGAAALAALAWRGCGRGAFLLLPFPATCAEALAGQNALLSCSLLVGGMLQLDKRPALAGVLLGAVAYKPQLFLMVPVALVAARAWRPLAHTVAAAAMLALLSAVAFGPQVWWLWLDGIAHGANDAQTQWYDQTFLTGYSFYVCAVLAGMAPAAAQVVQAAASVAAAAAVWRSYRGERPAGAALGVLLVATVMATPHLQAYDLLLVGAAAVLFFIGGRQEIGPSEVVLFAAAWALPMLRPSLGPADVCLVPVIMAALLVAGMRRADQECGVGQTGPLIGAPALG
jgi:hypothetical protein